MRDPFSDYVSDISSSVSLGWRRIFISRWLMRRVCAEAAECWTPGVGPLVLSERVQAKLDPVTIIIILNLLAQVLPIIIQKIVEWLQSRNNQWPAGVLPGARTCLQTGV